LSSRGPSILGWMATVRRMRCISIHPMRECRSDDEDRAMTGDSGTLRPNLRRFKSKVLLDSAHPTARVVPTGRKCCASYWRPVDSRRGARRLGATPLRRRIRASGAVLWQPEICGAL